MKKSFLLCVLISFMLIGCNSNNAQNSDNVNTPEVEPSEPITPNEPNEPNTPIEPVEVKSTTKYTIDFNADYIQTGDVQTKDLEARMMANFNHSATILSSFTTSGYIQINNKKADGVNNNVFLFLSTSSSDGSLTLNFVRKLVSLTIKAAPYKVYIPYSDSYSLDENPLLNINEKDWQFTTGSKETTDIEYSEKSFEINQESVTLKGYASKRVYISSLTMEIEDE